MKTLTSLTAHQIPYDQRPVEECLLVLHQYWSRQKTCWRENQWQSEGLHPLGRHGIETNVRDIHKKTEFKNITKLLFKECFFLSCFFFPKGCLLFLDILPGNTKLCFCISQRLFCFSHRRHCVFNEKLKPEVAQEKIGVFSSWNTISHGIYHASV